MTIFYCTQTFVNVVLLRATVFAKCILAPSRLRNNCKSDENIHCSETLGHKISEEIPRSLLLSGKIPLLASRSLLLQVKKLSIEHRRAFKGGRWCCWCFTWSLLPTCLGEKIPACVLMHSHNQRRPAALVVAPTLGCSPLFVCAVAQSRHPLWPRTVCTLFPSESRALPAPLSARRPPQLKQPNGGSLFV